MEKYFNVLMILVFVIVLLAVVRMMSLPTLTRILALIPMMVATPTIVN